MTVDQQRRAGLRWGVLAWYGATARALPWRAPGTDPYAVLVSEVMLQQTQAARVAPAYQAFLAAFPTAPALAAAPLDEVLRRWGGLGYPRRARALWRTAGVLVAEHGGRVPDDLDALLALPGIGDYTARAVLTFGFGRPVAPVDVNVARVMARAVAGAPLARTVVAEVAEEQVLAVGPGRAAAWNHALMDLGARVCTARAPRCGECPVAALCAWRSGSGPDEGPDPAAGSAVRSRPQAAFRGSDRYHRGRLMRALRSGHVARAAVPAAADLHDAGRLERVVDGLLRDGLARWEAGALALPGGGGGRPHSDGGREAP